MILDALRRRSPSRERDEAPSTARTDAVLRTLGYSRRHGHSATSGKKLVLYAVVALLIGFVGLSLLITLFAPPANQGSTAQRTTQTAAPPRSTQVPALPSASAASQTSPPSTAATPVNVTEPPTGRSSAALQSAAAQPRLPQTPNTAESRPPPASSPQTAAVPPSPPAQAFAVVPSQVPARPAVDDFGLALYYQRFGDYQAASSLYSGVVTKHGPSAAVHNNEGVMLIDRGEAAGAILQLREALTLDPKHVGAQNNLGVALLNAGRLDEAVKALNIALGQDPRNVESIVNLALVHKAAGRPAEARDLLQRAVAVDPRSAGAHYNLAVVADEAGETALAADHYRAFLRYGTVQYADLVAPVRARLTTLGR